MAIYYLAPDNDKPSWGIGVIYHHVKALVEAGIDVYILHENKGFVLPWLEVEVPIKYQTDCPPQKFTEKDTLIVPEVLVAIDYLRNVKANKIVFIQAPAYIFRNLPSKENHIDLGYKSSIVILPHIIPIVDQFVKLPHTLIPPMIADYFFEGDYTAKRKKEIVIYPKFSQVDFTIIRNLILRKIGHNKVKKALGFDWRLSLLQELSHKKVAQTLQKASIFISVNLFEALNTSVVEAMASGCIVFCYEGFGPRDYLENEKNAFVFPNNEPYQLIEKLYEVLDNFDSLQPKLNEIRKNARKTAEYFSYTNMKDKLLENIKDIANL